MKREEQQAFEGLSLGIATSEEERAAVFRLRHEAYLAIDAIEPAPDGIFRDPYDALPTTVLITVTDDRALAGALRFALQLPPDEQFGFVESCPEAGPFSDVVARLLADGRPLASGSRFSILPGHPRRGVVSLLLIGALAKLASAARAKWGISTARAAHVKFYERLMGMRPVSEERQMPFLTDRYRLLAVDVADGFETTVGAMPDVLKPFFAGADQPWLREALRLLAAHDPARRFMRD
ncbi:MAG: hypothetical protein AAFP17_14840 [Pseudomonadota bacterium]